MIAQPYHLYVERIDPEKNMARFYALAVRNAWAADDSSL